METLSLHKSKWKLFSLYIILKGYKIDSAIPVYK